MSIIKHKLSNSQRPGFKRPGFKRPGLDRHGLSVIEVLTSIVVALIGVFGVLAMIPFSVKQTQSGLDQDAATSMARNALANFEASGFNIKSEVGGFEVGGLSPSFQLNWLDEGLNPVRTGTGTGTQAGSVTNCGGLLCIDPLGITESDITESGDFASASFPFHNESLPDNLVLPPSLPGGPLVIPAVTLARPGGAPFSLADARRMFRLTDDLVFEQADDPSVEDSDLLGPVQIFNEGPGGLLNRQSNGTISWCALVHPQGAANSPGVENCKFYILAFKDRETTVDPSPMVTDGKMAAALVTSPITFGQAATVTVDDPANPIRFGDQVRRNDWVMLINRRSGNEPVFSRTNISFARVANVSSDEAMGTSSLTLDGPDFLFTTPTPAENATYIVHLRDVVAVFPRTIKLEASSEWTASAD